MTKNGTAPFTLTANAYSEGYKTTKLEIVLTNNSGSDLEDFVFCATIPRQFIPESLKGAMLQFSEGSYFELAPLGLPDNTLKNGESWTFSGENITLPMRHFTDGPSGVFLKTTTGRLRDGTTYITVPDTPLVFPEFKDTVPEIPIPETAPNNGKTVPIIPAPNGVEFRDYECCALGRGFAFEIEDEQAQQAVHTAVTLSDTLFKAKTMIMPHKKGTPVTLRKNATLGKESYILDIEDSFVLIEASSPTGYFYGLISLLHMVNGYTYGRAVRIEDTPHFPYRGLHLDVVRQFYSVAEVKRVIDIMAINKINVLHWHVTDDESWRIEIKALPELTEKLAYRGVDELVPPGWGSGYQSNGGYYTQEQVKDIVAYAGARGIDVIPEIDVPGHCFGVLRALEETLVEKTDNSQFFSVQNYSRNTLNPALGSTYDFIETVMGEIAQLFPADYIHIGADERPSGAWLGSQECRALMETENLKDGHALQTYFIKKIHPIIRNNGKIMGAWEEATEDGEIDSDLYVVSWRGSIAGIKAAAKGHNVVMCPAQYLYLDMAQSEHPYDPGLSWAGSSDVSKAYNYDPLNCTDEIEITDAIREKIKGVQGCLWGETVWEKRRVDFMILPRLSAVAEIGWTNPENKDEARFMYHVNASLFPLLDKGDIGYRPFDFISNHQNYLERV